MANLVVFVVWVVSLVFLGIAAFIPTRWNLGWVGLFLFDMWIGLQYILETTDPITF